MRGEWVSNPSNSKEKRISFTFERKMATKNKPTATLLNFQIKFFEWIKAKTNNPILVWSFEFGDKISSGKWKRQGNCLFIFFSRSNWLDIGHDEKIIIKDTSTTVAHSRLRSIIIGVVVGKRSENKFQSLVYTYNNIFSGFPMALVL